MEDTRLVVFNFLFLFLCVFLFFLLVFSFYRGHAIISLVRYFLAETYSFKNIFQMEVFVNVFLPTEQLVRISW